MFLVNFLHSLITGIKQTSALEFIAVIAGIASVWFSKKENILVYPIGLINTIIYTWLCFKVWGLFAEGSLNFYYTAMSIYGWYCWSRKGHTNNLNISYNTKKEWLYAVSFFILCWIFLYFFLNKFTSSTVPIADSFASATAYTAMWQMTRKKIENWIWWIFTNLASIPLYFYKGAVFTSFQYIVFLILAVAGLIEWKKKYLNNIFFI
jgi:nicotinamide mononucleotide transporter